MLGNDAVEDVQVGAADRAGRHLDDGVARMLDLRIGHALAAHVALAVPGQCFHFVPSAWICTANERAADFVALCLRTTSRMTRARPCARACTDCRQSYRLGLRRRRLAAPARIVLSWRRTTEHLSPTASPGTSEGPFPQNPIGRCGFHLIGEALAIKGHQGIVGVVPRAAQRVAPAARRESPGRSPP